MAVETYVVDTLTTRDVTLRERTDFWSEHVTSYQSRMGFMYPRTDNFHAGTIRQCTDAYQLVMFWSDTIKYTRTAGQARRDPDEDYRLLLPVAGEMLLRQEDREVRLVPGAGCLISFATPFEILQEASMRALIMSIAAQEVNGRLNRSSPLTAGLDLTSGLGRVVGGMLTGLHEERDTLTSGQFDAVSDRLVELLCMLAAGEDRPTAPGHLADVETVVRRYIREHAADPDMTGVTVAQALGWSLRQVQLVLQHAGTTPRELIREERLRLVRDRLRAPAYRHMTITELAYASGFSSSSALSTAFRQRFGVCPREMRHAGPSPSAIRAGIARTEGRPDHRQASGRQDGLA
ncbi:helix-turn-helix domain-containing protein [Streptomyces atratus]|uniref:AraC family transcriptional regulator n=1 Tax=Streptomyces atratus TaxID=1893 RepID=A0A2Z5JSJ9_STRAR|nr:helix-turn-helix domain-containing protein [Streptomyces atratus]AXE75731.1 AraC family transcriptional regulator [Streptomyces atratus]AXE82435.1 AraC family transcriptional regulator [Streptomyces atratus]